MGIFFTMKNKRVYDYNLIGGYSNFENELDISVDYKNRGYYSVIIENPAVIFGDFIMLAMLTESSKRRKSIS